MKTPVKITLIEDANPNQEHYYKVETGKDVIACKLFRYNEPIDSIWSQEKALKEATELAQFVHENGLKKETIILEL